MAGAIDNYYQLLVTTSKALVTSSDALVPSREHCLNDSPNQRSTFAPPTVLREDRREIC